MLTRSISRFFHLYCSLPTQQTWSCLKGFMLGQGIIFICFLFLYNFLTFCKAWYQTLIFLVMASWHLIQEADIVDGKAGCLCSWVLCTCYRAKSCSKNRAPQSVDCSPRHSHILMLGNNDSTMPDRQHAKDDVIFIFYFCHTSQFIHFLSIFGSIAFAAAVTDARVHMNHIFIESPMYVCI